MQRILRRRIFRDLKENFLRYFALGALIALGMYMIVSVVGAAETIIVGMKENGIENHVEDGEFGVFVPLTKEEEEKLIAEGLILENMFCMDFKQEDNSTLRVFANRENINQIVLNKGKLAQDKNEIVLEKRYCEENGLQVGDKVEIAGIQFEITGIGTVPDYESVLENLSDSVIDSKKFGLAFVVNEAYTSLKESGKSEKSEQYQYAYLLDDSMSYEELKKELNTIKFSKDDVDDIYFQEYWDNSIGKKDKLKQAMEELVDGSKELSSSLNEASTFYKEIQPMAEGSDALYDGIKKLQDSTNTLMDEYFDIDVSNMTFFLKADDNPRIGTAADDNRINKVTGLVAGIIVMILFTYVISVFVIHGIEKESSVIGALYALGVKKRDLMVHYLVLPVLITCIAGVIGTVFGFSKYGVSVQMRESYSYFSMPDLKRIYPVYLLIYSLIMPSIVALLVNCAVIQKRLSAPALKLIKNEQKVRKATNVNLGDMGFVRRFQIKQMMREARTGVTVVFGMFISLLIMMIGINCYVLCMHIGKENKEDIHYEYMYTYKYPEEKIPEGGEACYAKVLKKERFGYHFDVTIMGIDRDNPYLDVQVKEGKNQLVVSSAMAQKYGLKVGDQVVLADEEAEVDYAFRVSEIMQYSVGLYAFMDITSMRELFSVEDNYYNVVLSGKELDIEKGRLYATTTKEDISKASDIFIEKMQSLVIMMCTVSAIIFAVVMYLMLKVMIDRSAFHISLVKIFGYRMKEIRKLYLNGNFMIVSIGAVICIPLAKIIMDALYPYLVSNVACGINLKFTWQLYVGIYAFVIVLYMIINQMLVARLKKIVPAEVLKNRE
ncbi:FtsX-like permease family protein [Anaerosporobacter sp.]|uniref:FtsX-like permease family protein n=1 Tax=Anaerosporobacter sp. TaxID=1872529 RepID=UPI00286F801A|nr:FtsX-like permease family protein [Anaerosporobacter sp.]